MNSCGVRSGVARCQGIAYDANGNTLSDPSGKSYTWDFENRLTQVVNPGVGTTTFKYDPFGRRIQKSGPLGTTNYLYDGPSLVEQIDQSGNVFARYTQSTSVDEPLAELRSSSTSYYDADGLASITSLTGSSGTIAASYTYDSFGQLTASTGSVANPFQYTARDFDAETGLRFYRARYYDPFSGRFLSEDPLKFTDGANFYSYVQNSPLTNTDPTGLAHCYMNINGGSLICIPDSVLNDIVIIPVWSGNNGMGMECRNNRDCARNKDRGPIPPGEWHWTDQSTGKPNGRVLVPEPFTNTYDRQRFLFRSHSCTVPNGPGKGPDFCSEGCITGWEKDIQKLNRLLDAEPGSGLSVF